MIVKVEVHDNEIKIFNQNKSHDYRVPLNRTDVLSRLSGKKQAYFHAQILNGDFILAREVPWRDWN